MTASETTRRVLQACIDRWAGDDPEAIVGLFDDDATWDDPVGSEPRRGIDASARCTPAPSPRPA